MKSLTKALSAVLAVVFGVGVFAADERPIVPSNENVSVRYAVQSGNSYSQSGATLKGATSESMMQNQIAYRYPGKTVLILSARPNNSKGVLVQVSYTLTNKSGSVSRSSTTLMDALTESMARNQLQVRHPTYKVGILSMSSKKR